MTGFSGEIQMAVNMLPEFNIFFADALQLLLYKTSARMTIQHPNGEVPKMTKVI